MAPLPRPSLPNCYCDPEALPRGHGAKPTETGTRVLGWCRMARGPALLSPLPEPRPSASCSPPQAVSSSCSPREGGWRAPPCTVCVPTTPPGLASAPHWSRLLLILWQWSKGKGQAGSDGVFFYPSPPSRPHYPCPESIGGFRLSSDNASINPSVQGWKYSRGHGRFLVFLLPFQCPQA